MKNIWREKGYDEFITYFKCCLPNFFKWRFNRKTVKLFLHQNKVKKSFISLVRAMGFIDKLQKDL